MATEADLALAHLAAALAKVKDMPKQTFEQRLARLAKFNQEMRKPQDIDLKRSDD